MSVSDPEIRRREMIETQIAGRGIEDPRILEVMNRLPREAFLSTQLASQAYDDRALHVAYGQTISQPYIVAYMTESLRVEPHHRVLEIGTGTGYQTAILAKLAGEVYTIERLEALLQTAQSRLKRLGINNIQFRLGDGTLGWPEQAPFDRIIVTAAAPRIVSVFVDQLTDGGLLVMPVEGAGSCRLTTVQRFGQKIVERPAIAVRFVKLIGDGGFEA